MSQSDCDIGGIQGPLGYVSALGTTRLVYAPRALTDPRGPFILKSLNASNATKFRKVLIWMKGLACRI